MVSTLAPTLGPTIGGWITDSTKLALALFHQCGARSIYRHHSSLLARWMKPISEC